MQPVSLPVCLKHRMHCRMLPASLPACLLRRMLPAYPKSRMPPACPMRRKLLTEPQPPSLSNQINLKVP
jgi:hypothetical protein